MEMDVRYMRILCTIFTTFCTFNTNLDWKFILKLFPSVINLKKYKA